MLSLLAMAGPAIGRRNTMQVNIRVFDAGDLDNGIK